MDKLLCKMAYMQDVAGLASFVRTRMSEQKLTTYDVAEIAAQKGFKIVHGTVWNVLNATVKEVKDKTLVAIAHGINEKPERLREIVRGEESNATDFDKKLLYAASGAENWSEEQKERFLQTVRTYAAGIRAERQK